MTVHRIRPRIFIGVEGKSEQSFCEFLRITAERQGVMVHLDTHLCGGGGYRTIFESSIKARQRSQKAGPLATAILLMDGDRAESGDWSEAEILAKAREQRFKCVFQRPCHEAWLIRLHQGHEKDRLDVTTLSRAMISVWPEYRKPADKISLQKRYTEENLFSLARADAELRKFFELIGIRIP